MKASGALWTMIHGDCTEVLPTLGAVTHCISDPPYEADAHTKARRTLKGGGSQLARKFEVRRIDAPIGIDFSAMDPATRAALATYCGEHVERWSMAFCQIEAVGTWRAAFEAAHLDWVRGMFWHKPNGSPQFTGDRPAQAGECIALAHPKRKKRWNGGGSRGFFEFNLEHATGGGEGPNEHPTMKPLALMLRLVELFTDPGDLVLDPFAGSGTTGLACVRLGRRFVGIERQEKYFRLSCERLRAEEAGTTVQAARAGQAALFGGTDNLAGSMKHVQEGPTE